MFKFSPSFPLYASFMIEKPCFLAENRKKIKFKKSGKKSHQYSVPTLPYPHPLHHKTEKSFCSVYFWNNYFPSPILKMLVRHLPTGSGKVNHFMHLQEFVSVPYQADRNTSVLESRL